MFKIVEMEDSICILPHLFGNELEAAEIELSKKYANKVIRDVGLIICLYSVDAIEEGYVYTSQGSCHSKVRFKLISFLPNIGDTITGTVRYATSTSMYVSLEFFDDIIVPSTELRDPSWYNPENQMWCWKYEEGGEQHDLYYATGNPIRVRVQAVEFTKDKKTSDNSYLPPLIIHASVAEDGLGPPQW
eukprot:CAMPEP_0117036484 /NCGR_PEP_ID=MMETSP0472-20121206/25842_1 /TAXON_ID=693140 ORGANISM="Tiarina fusus, Strain LIS" /NCGR_SAMPLE_ID=MMETSP0472 /ASSEMBLY_ACC=CAM_ASM_000603 /LENGTH=187 /DNA_ID=CAMNT_0004746255 /DNA_START=11 /DNA_END=571 /DNA_ORIENTATION=-